MPTQNAKVMFKRGSQASLNTLIANNTFTEGTFYLTNDTNRLYFAQENNKLVDLNQYIHIADSINLSSLPNTSTVGYENLQKGDIYYWSQHNILAICDNPASGTWVQLNADTKLVPSVNGAITVTDGATTIDIGMAVSDSKNNQATGSFSLKGAGATTLSRNGNEITITSANDNDDTHYTLGTTTSATTGAISLTASNVAGATSSSISLVGSGGVSISSDANGEITISSVGGVGGVTNAFDETTGEFVTSLSVIGGNVASAPVTPTITYGENNNQSAVFAGGTAALSVYTKTEVDNKITAELKTFDAMEYAGVLDPDDAATELVATKTAGETPKVGTTWKAGGHISRGSLPIDQDAHAGDLIIAKGTDGNVTWEVVPSGNDQLITGNVTGNSMIISDNNSPIAGITVEGSTNTYGTISATPSISGNLNTITIAHGAAGTGSAVTYAAASSSTTQTTGTALSIPTITSISKDAAGHITALETATYSITDTHNTLDSVSFGAQASNNEAAIALTVKDGDSSGKSGVFNLKSDTLTITTSVAGTTPVVTADLIWGSF